MLSCEELKERETEGKKGTKRSRNRLSVCVSALQQNQNYAPRTVETPKNQTKNQMWTGVLHITLVEGQDLPQCGQGDVYVRFRLGDQKYRSKVWAYVLFFAFKILPKTFFFFFLLSLL